MRWTWIVCGLLAVSAVALSPSEAKEGETKAPTTGDIAEWIRGGNDADLDRAAQAAAKLAAPGLREVFQEIRDQTKLHMLLAKKRIKGLTWEQVNLDTAVSYLATITGVSFYVTPKLRAEKLEDIAIDIAMDDVCVSDVLDLLTNPYGCAWRVRGGIVQLGTNEEFDVSYKLDVGSTKDAVAEAMLRKKIDATKVTLRVKEQKLPEVVKTLQIQTGFNIVIDPRISSELAMATVSSLSLTDVAVSTVLNMLADQGGDESIVWTVRGNVILITSNEYLKRK